MDKNKYAILILAAGNSTRLGRPKQLVKWNHSTLLNYTIDQASKVDNADIYVALGGNQAEILPLVLGRVKLLDIQNWQGGMGTTISSSLKQIDVDIYDGIILSVCDQPYISNEEFNNLIYTFEDRNSSIIVSEYKNGFGPPTLFAKKHFSNLLLMRGDNGAKKIIRKHLDTDDVSFIFFENGDVDIDTEDDIKNLSAN